MLFMPHSHPVNRMWQPRFICQVIFVHLTGISFISYLIHRRKWARYICGQIYCFCISDNMSILVSAWPSEAPNSSDECYTTSTASSTARQCDQCSKAALQCNRIYYWAMVNTHPFYFFVWKSGVFTLYCRWSQQRNMILTGKTWDWPS